MVFSIRCKDRQKSLLLRNANGRGPVLKGVFHEIDAKMVDVKPGKNVFYLWILLGIFCVISDLTLGGKFQGKHFSFLRVRWKLYVQIIQSQVKTLLGL